MSQILVILWAKWRMACHSVASVRHESKLKVGVIAISATLLWLGAYFTFSEGFHWLLAFGSKMDGFIHGIGTIIMVRLLGVLSVVVFFMLIFSNILISFSTLYRSREVAYLIQAPMAFRDLFVARFFECATFSSWALAFLGSPLILAYGRANHVPWLFYVAAVVFFVPFITLPASLGCIITLGLVRVFPRLKMRSMVLLAAGAVVLFFLYWGRAFTASRLAEDSILPALLDVTTQTQAPYLPSSWASRGVLAASTGNHGECLFNLLFLFANALMAVWLATLAAHWFFHPGWSSLAGQDRTRRRPVGQGFLGRMDSFFRVLPNPVRSLALKDIRLFWRDPSQWSQFVIFFGIMAVYIANLRNTHRHYEQEFWRSWIACLNIGACSLILATLTSRFVFPLVSLEGRRFWILGLAPIHFRQVVLQKFWLSVATTSLFTVGLAVLSGRMLKLEPIYFALSVYSIIVANFGLAGLAVGLGSVYPNFQEDNPARIVSGMGGTLNFLLSVGYIGCVVGAQTLLMQSRVMGLFASDRAFHMSLAGGILGVTGLSVVATLLPMHLGLRNLTKAEF